MYTKRIDDALNMMPSASPIFVEIEIGRGMSNHLINILNSKNLMAVDVRCTQLDLSDINSFKNFEFAKYDVIILADFTRAMPSLYKPILDFVNSLGKQVIVLGKEEEILDKTLFGTFVVAK